MEAEAVTVTALGVRKQNRALGYATSTVKGDQIARTNTISPANALQGKVAGVQIQTSGSGGLTTAPAVQIRGASSLTKNNSPIYVIDGIIMQYEEQSDGDRWAIAGSSDGTRFGNQLKNLNPDDYESITVLKGAAATSLYGSRGANGAIVITTKGGKARKGIGLEVKYTHEWQDTYQNALPLQNTFGMGNNTNGYEGGVNPNAQSTATGYSTVSWGPSYASMKDTPIYQYYKYYSPDGISNPLDAYRAYPDNWKIFYRTGQYDNISVAMTGGSDKATYRLSYGYTSNNGTMAKNSFNRHSVNFTTNGKLNDIFSVNMNLQYSNSNTQNAISFSRWSWDMPSMYVGWNANRSTDLQWYANHYINPETYERYGTNSLGAINGYLNKLSDNNSNRNEQTIIASLGLTANLNEWLDAGVSLTYNNWQIASDTKNWGGGIGRTGGGYYGVSGSTSGSYNGIAQIHGNKRFLDDNLELDIRLMGEIYGDQYGSSYSKGTDGGLIVPGVWSFSNSKNPITINQVGANQGRRSSMTVGVAGLINLSWKNQIYLEVTGRNDWLSSLLYPTWIPYGADNYSVFYPSVNASWVFTDTFQIDPNIISFGKLRASWAQVGMGTNAYTTASGAGGFNVSNINTPDGSSLLSASPNNNALPNYDLKPEIKQSIEFGADIRFLNDRIGLDVAYYKTNTKNQILSLSAVSESGVSSQWVNAGNIQNQGWELQLDFTPIKTRTVTWDISANWTRNRGKIKELLPNQNHYTILSNATGDAAPGIYAFVNGAYGVIAAGNNYGGTQPIGLYNNKDNANDPNNGKRLIYLSTKSAGNINNVVTTLTANNIPGYFGEEAEYWGGKKNLTTILGNVQPKFIFGINTTVNINLPNNNGSIDFFGQIDGRSGGTMINGVSKYMAQTGSLEATLYGRSKELGGEARINYKGETVYNGVVYDGVFTPQENLKGYVTVTSMKTGEEVYLGGMTMREAVDAGHIQPVLAANYYNGGALGARPESTTSKQSYVSLREITLGYNFPQKWIKYVGLQNARMSFTARNLCYIYNGLRYGANPESFTANNPLIPVDFGSTPFVRNFAFTLDLRF